MSDQESVYLAGPISSRPDYQAFFAEWREKLRPFYADCRVVSPAAMPEVPGHTWSDYVARSMPLLLSCDMVAVLPGWRDSVGTVVECFLAQVLGKPASFWTVGPDGVSPILDAAIHLGCNRTPVKRLWHATNWLKANAPTPFTSRMDEAAALIGGDRRRDYGPPEQDYGRAAALWSAATGRSMTATEGVLFMMCVKISRQMNSPKRDNIVDLHGYAEILADMMEGEDA